MKRKLDFSFLLPGRSNSCAVEYVYFRLCDLDSRFPPWNKFWSAVHLLTQVLHLYLSLTVSQFTVGKQQFSWWCFSQEVNRLVVVFLINQFKFPVYVCLTKMFNMFEAILLLLLFGRFYFTHESSLSLTSLLVAKQSHVIVTYYSKIILQNMFKSFAIRICASATICCAFYNRPANPCILSVKLEIIVVNYTQKMWNIWKCCKWKQQWLNVNFWNIKLVFIY